MEIRVLKYFIAVADHGSVSAAARAVHVAQPSVSRQLKQLERVLGVELFERSHGGLTLTPAGEHFRPVAEDLIWRNETASRLFTDPAAHDRRFLIVAHSTTEKRVLAPFSAEIGQKYPRMDVINEAPLSVFSTVDALHADIGVTTVAPPAGWEARYLSEVPLLAQVPTTHPVAELTSIDIKELSIYPLILMSRTHSARRTFDHAVASNNIQISTFLEAQSSLMAQAAAATGRGIAVVTDEAAFDLHSIPIMDRGNTLSFPIYAGWKQAHYGSGELDAWADDLAQWITANPSLTV